MARMGARHWVLTPRLIDSAVGPPSTLCNAKNTKTQPAFIQAAAELTEREREKEREREDTAPEEACGTEPRLRTGR